MLQVHFPHQTLFPLLPKARQCRNHEVFFVDAVHPVQGFHQGQVLTDTVFTSPPGVLNYNENITVSDNTIFMGGNVIGDGPDKYVLNAYQFIATSTLAPQESEVRIFPNPFQDQLTITSSVKTGPGNLVLTDIFGRNAFQKAIQLTGNDMISLPQLPPGAYSYRFKSRGRVISSGILIKRPK